jgi:hypothetical protein
MRGTDDDVRVGLVACIAAHAERGQLAAALPMQCSGGAAPASLLTPGAGQGRAGPWLTRPLLAGLPPSAGGGAAAAWVGAVATWTRRGAGVAASPALARPGRSPVC